MEQRSRCEQILMAPDAEKVVPWRRKDLLRLGWMLDKYLRKGSKRFFFFFFMLKAGEAAAKMCFKRRKVSALDSSESGNNHDGMHLLVNPFQKVVLPVGFFRDRYQSSVVLRMAAIRSRGSKRLKPLTQRKLTENWMKAGMTPGFFLEKLTGKFPLRQPASTEEQKLAEN